VVGGGAQVGVVVTAVTVDVEVTTMVGEEEGVPCPSGQLFLLWFFLSG